MLKMFDWFEWLKEHCTIKLKAPLNFSEESLSNKSEPLCSMCKLYKPVITKDMGDEFCFTCVVKRAKEVLDLGKPKYRSSINLNTPYTPTTQEDPRTVESIKRTKAAFKQQEVSMNMRALKAHAAECNDPWTCTSEPCFIREPDKIVNVEQASEKEVMRFNSVGARNKRILRNMNKARQKKS